MIAKLMVREVGQREFVQHNGDYLDLKPDDMPRVSAIECAAAEGERLCEEGNVEAFQVWQLVSTKQRVWKLEEVAA